MNVLTLQGGLVLRGVLLLRNLLILNLFLLIPSILAVCWTIEDRLDITVECSESVQVTVTADGEKKIGYCEGAGNLKTAQLVFSDGCPDDRLEFEYSVPSDRFTVQEIAVQRHFMFRKYLKSVSPRSTVFGYTINLERRWWKRLGLLEIGILVVAFAALFLKRKEKGKLGLLIPAVVSIHAGLFWTVVLPVGTLMAYREMLSGTLLELLPELILPFVGITAGAFVCIWMTSFVLGRFTSAMVMAFLIYEYLLTGPLMTDIPALDGDFGVLWESISYKPDFLSMLIVFGGIAICYRWIRKYLHWISLSFIILSLAAMFDLSMNGTGKKSRGHRFKTDGLPGIVKGLHYSPKRNVFVLVVDSVRADVAEKLVCENSELREAFDGFIAFDNNLGMHPFSQFAVPGFATGQYYVPGSDTIAYLDTQRGTNSYLVAYEKAGAAIYYGTDSENHRYSNRPLPPPVHLQGKSTSVFRRRANVVPPLNLLDIIRFRTVPVFWKCLSIQYALSGVGAQMNYGREHRLYPLLAEASIDERENFVLCHFHTMGSHPQQNLDRNCNVVAQARPPAVAEYEHTFGVFNELKKLMIALRKRKLFDQSLVLVLADHGNDAAPVAGVDGRSKPMLWVKPFGAHGEIIHSRVPSSHAKVRDLLVDAVTNNRSTEEIERLLTDADRKYIYVKHNGQEDPSHTEH